MKQAVYKWMNLTRSNLLWYFSVGISNAFYLCFRPKMAGFRNLRRQLDDLGYYQPLVLDAVPLVEALVQDLLTTTHNLKVRGFDSFLKLTCELIVHRVFNKQVCKDESQQHRKVIHSRQVGSTSSPGHHPSFHLDEAKVTKLETRVKDLEILNGECRQLINRQQARHWKSVMWKFSPLVLFPTLYFVLTFCTDGKGSPFSLILSHAKNKCHKMS